jgi:putative acetyltransferase
VGKAIPGPADFDDAGLKSLIDLHLAAMREHSPPESVHALDASGLSAPGTDLFVLSEDGQAVAMGAVRRIDATAFEIKSMRVRPDRLGRGLGQAMLEHLIAEAASRGATRLSLETGSGPAFEPALKLYQSRGFRPGGAFGDYQATAFNQFFHLDMDLV